MLEIEQMLVSGTVQAENLERNNANFSMTFNIPRLPAYAFSEQDPDFDRSQLVIPFVLPPLQDHWTKTVVGSDTPMSVLKSMSVSLDLGMGPNAAFDTWDGTATPDDSEFESERAFTYDMDIEIRSKDQSYVYGDSADVVYNVPKESIYSGSIPGMAFFNGMAQQFNPVFITDINEAIDPLKTYTLNINFPNLWEGWVNDVDATERAAISSLTMKLNFEGAIQERDVYVSGSYGIQNIPTSMSGTKSGQSITFDSVTSGSNITARAGTAANGRLQRNAEILDVNASKGLAAGRDIRGVQPAEEPIEADTGYFVLAVPMFGGWNDIRASDINEIGLPYGPQQTSGTLDPWSGNIQDRRIIPISQPFTIHRVIAVHSYYSHAHTDGSSYPNFDGDGRDGGTWGAGHVPSNASFTSAIGVGISTGLRADAKEYEQVAYATMTPGDKTDYLVDRVKSGKFAPGWGGGTWTNNNYDFEIFEIPLVENVVSGENTRGYYNQGFPYYVGKSGLGTYERQPVGTVAGGTREPNTEGGELVMEVRWIISDAGGLNVGAGAHTNNTCFVGMGGNWVYIYGKMSTSTTHI